MDNLRYKRESEVIFSTFFTTDINFTACPIIFAWRSQGSIKPSARKVLIFQNRIREKSWKEKVEWQSDQGGGEGPGGFQYKITRNWKIDHHWCLEKGTGFPIWDNRFPEWGSQKGFPVFQMGYHFSQKGLRGVDRLKISPSIWILEPKKQYFFGDFWAFPG